MGRGGGEREGGRGEGMSLKGQLDPKQTPVMSVLESLCRHTSVEATRATNDAFEHSARPPVSLSLCPSISLSVCVSFLCLCGEVCVLDWPGPVFVCWAGSPIRSLRLSVRRCVCAPVFLCLCAGPATTRVSPTWSVLPLLLSSCACVRARACLLNSWPVRGPLYTCVCVFVYICIESSRARDRGPLIPSSLCCLPLSLIHTHSLCLSVCHGTEQQLPAT